MRVNYIYPNEEILDRCNEIEIALLGEAISKADITSEILNACVDK